jgi:hypothetical protein
MSGLMLRACGTLVIWVVLSPAGAEPPARYPVLDEDRAQEAIVVARVSPGGYLPQFDECNDTTRICMDPPPFWFRADVEKVVVGNAPLDSLQVATTSHYGMTESWSDAVPRLMLLVSDGENFIMRRYASAELAEDRQGALHLLVLRSQPIWWMPCSVWGLREDASADEFGDAIRVDRDHLQRIPRQDRKSLFRRAGRYAVARYVIPVERIRQHFDAMPGSGEIPRCETE